MYLHSVLYNYDNVCIETDAIGGHRDADATSTGHSDTPQHNFNNPIYGESATTSTSAGNDDQHSREWLREVPNPLYGDSRDDELAHSIQESPTSPEDSGSSPPRISISPDREGHPQRQRVKHVVYESTDKVCGHPVNDHDKARSDEKKMAGAVQSEKCYDIKAFGPQSTSAVYDRLGQGISKAAAKPNSRDDFTHSAQRERQFDDELYNAPFSSSSSRPPQGANFASSTN